MNDITPADAGVHFTLEIMGSLWYNQWVFLKNEV